MTGHGRCAQVYGVDKGQELRVEVLLKQVGGGLGSLAGVLGRWAEGAASWRCGAVGPCLQRTRSRRGAAAGPGQPDAPRNAPLPGSHPP